MTTATMLSLKQVLLMLSVLLFSTVHSFPKSSNGDAVRNVPEIPGSQETDVRIVMANDFADVLEDPTGINTASHSEDYESDLTSHNDAARAKGKIRAPKKAAKKPAAKKSSKKQAAARRSSWRPNKSPKRATTTCPSAHPYVYFNGEYCCKYDREKTYAGDGLLCDGGAIGLSSRCCKDDEATPCVAPPCSNYVKTATCPSAHPYAYLNGDWCCKYDQEKTYAGDGSLCDGGAIGLSSTCCKDDQATRCVAPPCSNYVKTGCKDESIACRNYVNRCRNYATVWTTYMENRCRRTCKYC